MSSTRLSALLDGVLEACWLAAIIVTPLFFNTYSNRVFEPDKLTTLRSIAMVMAAAWLIRWVEERVGGRRGGANTPSSRITWRTPLVLPTLFTVLVYLISTAFSVTPYVSFFGSYQRLQGTFTTLSYIVVFLIVLDRMRTRAQVDRFITTLILNSLPIALYGFVQHARRDPLPWGGDVTRRIASNMGNAIFVAAYLIMAAPPTLARIVDSFRSILTDEDAGVAEVLRASAYIFIFLVQVIAVYYTKSRGPLMGLLFGLAVWLFLGLIAFQRHLRRGGGYHPRQWRWLWIGALAAMAVFAVLFFAVNPGGPFHEWASQQPWLGRLARVLEYESGTGKVRSLIWEGALQMILPHDPIRFPPTITNEDWRPDPFNSIRLLVGYGPESMYVAYNRFYPPLLGHYESRTASPDRSHNETLDSVVITGLLGFVAYMWLFGSLFYLGLRWLGILPDGWRRTLFFALLAGGAAVAVVWTGVAIGPHFFGLAIPIGMAVGLLIYLIIYGVATPSDLEAAGEVHPHTLLLIGIFSTFIAHFVEINFGIAIAATRTTFWTLAGVFVLLGLQQIVEEEQIVPRPTPRSQRRKKRRRRTAPAPPRRPSSSSPAWLWPALGAGLIGALITGTLAYDFVNNPERLTDPLAILWRSLAVIAVPASRPPRTSLGILMVFGMAWLLTGLLTVTQMIRRGSLRKRDDVWAAALVVLAVSLAAGLVFGLVMAGRHAHVARVASDELQSVADAVALAEYMAGHMNGYYVYLLVVIFLGGLALMGQWPIPRQWSTVAGGAVALVLVVVVPIAAYQLNLRPIRADIIYKQASPWDQERQWNVAIPHYQRAVELAPREDFYYLYLGRAYLEYASALEDTDQQSLALQETERVLLQAQAINPLNTDHSANLARMYRRWSDLPAGREYRRALAERSSYYYEVATSLSPNNAILWNEWATLYYYTLEDEEGFQSKIEHSLELDAEFEQTWLIIGDVRASNGDLEGAAEAYRTALEIKPNQRQVWSALGRVYLQMGMNQEAIEAFTEAVEMAPNARDVWDTHRLMAIAYYQAGSLDQALAEAQLALQLAPEERQAEIQQLIMQMQQSIQPPPEETSP